MKYKNFIYLLFLIVVSVLISKFMPDNIKQLALLISQSSMDIMSMLMPLFIFSVVNNNINNIKTTMLSSILIFLLIFASCILADWYAFLYSKIFTINNFQTLMTIDNENYQRLAINSIINFKSPIKPIHGLFCALILQFFTRNRPKINLMIQKASTVIFDLFKNFIIKILFSTIIIGVATRISENSIGNNNYKLYFTVLSNTFLMQLSYMVIWCLINENLRFSKLCVWLYSVVKLSFIAFCNMSSLITLPEVLGMAQKKNPNSKNIPLIATIASNYHLIGGSLGVSFIVLTAAKIKQGIVITAHSFLYFTLMVSFVSKFFISCIPGGGIYIIISIIGESFPILDKQTINFILTLFIIYEPFFSMFNVTGNSLFIEIADNVLNKFKFRSSNNKPIIDSKV